jgi:predicted ABC-type exoprotein transport system permease subunit
MHIGTSKIIISLLVCLGIFVYNYFSTHHKHEAMNQPLTPFTVTIIVVLLLLEGYRPDLQAQIKT